MGQEVQASGSPEEQGCFKIYKSAKWSETKVRLTYEQTKNR